MKKLSIGIMFAVALLLISACSSSGDNNNNNNNAEPNEDELIEVNLGLMPYFDYAPWALAEEKGFFEDEGLELNSMMFPVEGNVAPALVNGSIDFGAFSDTPSITLASQFDELKMVSFHHVFKGFAIMSHEDEEIKTYEQLVDELGDPDEAAIEAGKQLEGKSVVTTSGATFYMVLEQALTNAGLTMEDIDLIDMEPDAGVSAFISGTGDFYLGGLPQREKLQEEGFLPLISGDEIGPGAITQGGLASSEKFLDENPDVVEKIENVWFNAMEYTEENTEEAYDYMAEWSNEQGGGDSTGADVEEFFEDYVLLAGTVEEMESMFFDPDSDYYWKDRYEFLIDYHESTGEIDEGSVDIEKLVVAEEYFEKLKK